MIDAKRLAEMMQPGELREMADQVEASERARQARKAAPS